MLYIVDFGTHTEVATLNELEELYSDRIDHTEYPDFEDWMADMEKCGLVERK